MATTRATLARDGGIGPGPEGAPTLLFLHGLGATGGINWCGSQCFLRDRFRLVTMDLRGHGRGIRTRHFPLEDCADDAATLIATMAIERPIVVGYSMGGPIAALLWRRHPALVGGPGAAPAAPGPLLARSRRAPCRRRSSVPSGRPAQGAIPPHPA